MTTTVKFSTVNPGARGITVVRTEEMEAVPMIGDGVHLDGADYQVIQRAWEMRGEGDPPCLAVALSRLSGIVAAPAAALENAKAFAA